MHGADDCGGVNQRGSGRAGKPQEPVVPTGAANDEFRNAILEEALAKSKIVDPLSGPLAIRAKSEIPDLGGPVGAVEVQRLANIHIPAAAGHQERIELASDSRQGRAKIVEQQDVAVGIAEQVVARELPGPLKQEVSARRAQAIALGFRLVAQAEFAANFSGALFVAEENHLNVWMQPLPAFQRVALDDVNMPGKGLRRGEESDHRSRTSNPEFPRLRMASPQFIDPASAAAADSGGAAG